MGDFNWELSASKIPNPNPEIKDFFTGDFGGWGLRIPKKSHLKLTSDNCYEKFIAIDRNLVTVSDSTKSQSKNFCLGPNFGQEFW